MASLSARRPVARDDRSARSARTSPSAPPISNRELLGTWRLVHAQQYYSDGELHDESANELTGNLTYSEDGTARVALGAVDRLHVNAGEYSLRAGTSTITHHFDLCLYPDWPTDEFVARAHLTEDLLTLRATPCKASDGRTLLIILTWDRLQPPGRMQALGGAA